MSDESGKTGALCLDQWDHRNDAQGTLVAVFCHLPAGHEGPHTYTDVKSLNRGTRWLTYDVKWSYQSVPAHQGHEAWKEDVKDA